MSTQILSPQDAPAPFSGAPDPESPHRSADFILRSSDVFDFHVHGPPDSEVTRTSFAIPGGDGDLTPLWRHGLPVLALPEPKAVLSRLLCLAYPAESVTYYGLLNNQELIDAQPRSRLRLYLWTVYRLPSPRWSFSREPMPTSFRNSTTNAANGRRLSPKATMEPAFAP
ncbi:hypothetical protein C8R47DRAFT_1205369 [Mycena vitilis]|nr:hypothetical protein C8R47DRAFT_1205369 [Mycena vitilis]